MPGRRLRVTSDLRKSLEDAVKDLNESRIQEVYTAKNIEENRYIDENSTIEDLAKYVATLTNDLTKTGFIKK